MVARSYNYDRPTAAIHFSDPQFILYFVFLLSLIVVANVVVASSAGAAGAAGAAYSTTINNIANGFGPPYIVKLGPLIGWTPTPPLIEYSCG